MRLLLYTGKGGVGKTSIAAATAVRASQQGLNTLLVSSDRAHNLGDVFGRPVGEAAVRLGPCLTVLEVDVLQEIEANWEEVQAYMVQFFAYLGVDRVVAEEMAIFPGVDQIFLLTRILREVERGGYDAVVVDCAPTAATLGLLSFSDASSRKFNRILDWERKLIRLIRPLAKTTATGRQLVPEDSLYETFGKVIENIGRLGDLLKDGAVSSVRLVLNPDPIAVAETRRTYIYLALFGFPVDAVVVNKLLPEELATGFFEQTYEIQRSCMKTVRQAFLETPVLEAPYLASPPLGEEALGAFGEQIFQGREPLGIFGDGESVRFEEGGDGVVALSFKLPGIDKADLDLGRNENELIVRAGRHARVLQLPDRLASSEVGGARYEDGVLVVSFAKPEAKAEGVPEAD